MQLESKAWLYEILPEIEITHARRIVQTRNQIIHQYEHVSDEVIWDIIQTHLPLLKKEIEVLLPY